MLYAAIDTDQKKILDVIPHGDEQRFMREYVSLFNEITGQNVESFSSLEEAKSMCVQAVHDKTFGRTTNPPPRIRPPWLNEDGTPTVPQVEETEDQDTQRHLSQREGPLAKARVIFERMWGSPRRDIIEACAQAGIKRSTAATQYQSFKKMKEYAQEHCNPETGMPQLAPGVQVKNES